MIVQTIIEPPTLVATTISMMNAVCVMPPEEEAKEDGVALALALASTEEEVSVTYTTDGEDGESSCVCSAGVGCRFCVVDGVD